MLRMFFRGPKKHAITIERIGYARWTRTLEIKDSSTAGEALEAIHLGQQWLNDKYVLLNGKEVPLLAEVKDGDTVSIVD